MSHPRPFRFAVTTSRADSLASWTEIARRVEGLGFDVLAMPDHYLGLDADVPGGQGLAAVPALAAAAAVTTELRIAARVFCVDFHHPVVLAKQAVTLDVLSDGRFELGLGAGWTEAEYQQMGVRYDRAGLRVERLGEVVDLLKRFCRDGSVDQHGAHVDVNGLTAGPPPIQRPWPPLMIGGGGRRVLTLAAREADIVSVNSNNRTGMGPEALRTSTAAQMDEKIGWIRAAAGERLADIEIEIGGYFVAVTDSAQARAEELGRPLGLDADEMRQHGNALIGTVDEICEQLIARRERWGVSYVTIPLAVMDQFAPVVDRLAGT